MKTNKTMDLVNSDKLDIVSEAVSNFDAGFGADLISQNLQLAQAGVIKPNQPNFKNKDLLKSGLGLATTLAGGIVASRAGQTCKKPIFPENPLNRSNWQAYRDCVINEERERQRQFELQQAAKKEEEDKFLGMPKNVGIAVTIGGGLLIIGTIVYFATRK